MNDQRHDPDTRKRVEKIGNSYDWFARRTNWVLGGMTLAICLLAFFCARQISEIRSTAAVSRQTSATSRRTAAKLAGVVAVIQAERKTNIRRNCQDQNARHDHTVRRLKEFAARRHLPAARVQPSVSLIDALAPVADCDALVQRSVRR